MRVVRICVVRIVLLAFLLTLSAVTSADELTTFGFVLGKPLELSECTYRVIAGSKNYTYPAPKTCVQDPHTINRYGHPSRRIIFSNEECPLIVKNCQMIALEIDGTLAGIEFFTLGAVAQDAAMTELVKK